MSAISYLEEGQAPLVRVQTEGWRIGFGNLVRKEFGQWWRTRMWWIQTLLWIALLNGVTTMIILGGDGMSDAELTLETVQSFFLIAVTTIGIGIVLTVQSSIVSEKELGTAAWVMSKPASRVSFILSKITAHFVGFLVTAVLVPGAIFVVEAKLLLPEPVSVGGMMIGFSVLALAVLFFVILTVALGTVFKGRGPIAGIGIGLILVGQFFKGMLPLPLVLVTPWLLGDVAGAFAMDSFPEWNWMIPVGAVAAETLIFALLALWRFRREEF